MELSSTYWSKDTCNHKAPISSLIYYGIYLAMYFFANLMTIIIAVTILCVLAQSLAYPLIYFVILGIISTPAAFVV